MKKFQQILRIAFIAGTLDIIAACASAYLQKGTLPRIVLKYIASGVLGQAAFKAGTGVMLLGLLFHFIIAFACTAVFFLIYPKFEFLKKSVLLNAVFIGVIAWVVTTQMVIPMSEISKTPFNLAAAIRAVIILIVCIGFPVSYATKKYYQNQTI
jgi:hypothetical protein